MRANGNGAALLSEEQEMEWAAELLSVGNEAELEQFLGDIVSGIGKAASSVGRFVSSAVKSPAFQQLGGILKNVAKVGLPIAGKVAGSIFGGPVGGMIGGQLGSLASGALNEQEAFLGDIVGGLFGGELESMPQNEREFEAARRVVRLASTAAQDLAAAPPSPNPQAAAMQAIQSAAQKLGLAGQPMAMAGMEPARDHGRWVRRGNQLVIYGA
jgi:hypothetical protein